MRCLLIEGAKGICKEQIGLFQVSGSGTPSDLHDQHIEGFNRQLRKITKSKSVFPSDDALLKMLYLAMIDITKKWTGHRQDWGEIHSQLEIYFEERLEGHRY